MQSTKRICWKELPFVALSNKTKIFVIFFTYEHDSVKKPFWARFHYTRRISTWLDDQREVYIVDSTSFSFYKLNVLVLAESTCNQLKPDPLKD